MQGNILNLLLKTADCGKTLLVISNLKRNSEIRNRFVLTFSILNKY